MGLRWAGEGLLRTTNIGQDTLVAFIAIFVTVIKDTFFYASFRTVLRFTAFCVDAKIVSRDTGLVAWRPTWDALAIAISKVAGVILTTVRVISTAEAHGVSALCCSLRAGPITGIVLRYALFITLIIILVNIRLSVALSVAFS